MIEHPASISALPMSISGLIDRWPTISDFAADAGCGVGHEWRAGAAATDAAQGEAA